MDNLDLGTTSPELEENNSLENDAVSDGVDIVSNHLQELTVKKKAPPPSVLPTFLPPCRVCNGKASGLHYGVNTCEGCKAFFKRSIKPGTTIKPCTNDGKCETENAKGKRTCVSCRYNRCLEMGMTREGCKKGRYSAHKRTQDTNEVRKLQAEKGVLQQVQLNQCPQATEQLLQLFESILPDVVHIIEENSRIAERVRTSLREANILLPMKTPLCFPGKNSTPETQTWATDVMASLRCPDKRELGLYMLLEAWLTLLESTFHRITVFARQIPDFSNLMLDDRIILLKLGRGDILSMIGHYQFFIDLEAYVEYNMETEDLVVVPFAFMAEIFSQEAMDDLTMITKQMQKLNLVKEDIAVILAFVICAPYREGLQSPAEVEKIHNKLLPVLEYTLRKNHPDQPNILASTLLILPELCETADDLRLVEQLKSLINPKQFPLVYEILQQ